MADDQATTREPPARGQRRWIGYATGVAIVVGILVVITIPAPADHVLFMKLEKVVREARQCSDRVAEFAASSRRWPADASAAGCAPPSNAVAELRAEQGTIFVRLRGGGQFGGGLIRLDPFQDDAGLKAAAAGEPISLWKCSSADPETQKRLPKFCRRDTAGSGESQ